MSYGPARCQSEHCKRITEIRAIAPGDDALKFSRRGNAEECDLGTPPPQSARERRAVPDESPKLPKVTRGVSGGSWTASVFRQSAHEEETDQDMNRPCLLVLIGLLWRCCGAQQRGLFPAVLNLASMAEIKTNATCGETGPEMYCKLVEHVPGQPVKNPQCRTCNLKSDYDYERHPIEYAIDGTNRWWQSPSIMNGMDYHYVTVTLDLQQ
ncbi:hypothetical protein QQF64_016952, partial [Cirrhinus molitorella]